MYERTQTNDFTCQNSVGVDGWTIFHVVETLADIATRSENDETLGRLFEPLDGHPSDLPCVEIYVPGRVELLGKHTDYAGGSSLTFATSRCFRALAVEDPSQDEGPDSQPGLTMIDANGSGAVSVAWESAVQAPNGAPDWDVYPRIVVRRLVRHFGVPEHGVRVVFTSDLPQAAGLSSSSALLTTAALSMLCMTGMSKTRAFGSAVRSREDLAGFLGAVEAGAAFGDLPGDDGVGTRGGAQDHAAILCSEPGRLGLYSYLPVRCLEHLDFPEDMAFVVCHSGVDARKASDAREEYNNLSDLAERVGEAWAAAVVPAATDGGTNRSADSSPHAEPGTLAATIADPALDEAKVIDTIDRIARDPGDRRRLWHRFAQFHDECTIVLPAAVEAIRSCDWAAFSDAASTSQWMAEDWLENQVEETAYLARSARAFDAPAASAFGAGFGGAVWALVPAATAELFAERWVRNYRREYPRHAERARVFVERPSAPARWPSGAIAGID